MNTLLILVMHYLVAGAMAGGGGGDGWTYPCRNIKVRELARCKGTENDPSIRGEWYDEIKLTYYRVEQEPDSDEKCRRVGEVFLEGRFDIYGIGQGEQRMFADHLSTTEFFERGRYGLPEIRRVRMERANTTILFNMREFHFTDPRGTRASLSAVVYRARVKDWSKSPVEYEYVLLDNLERQFECRFGG